MALLSWMENVYTETASQGRINRQKFSRNLRRNSVAMWWQTESASTWAMHWQWLCPRWRWMETASILKLWRGLAFPIWKSILQSEKLIFSLRCNSLGPTHQQKTANLKNPLDGEFICSAFWMLYLGWDPTLEDATSRLATHTRVGKPESIFGPDTVSFVSLEAEPAECNNNWLPLYGLKAGHP